MLEGVFVKIWRSGKVFDGKIRCCNCNNSKMGWEWDENGAVGCGSMGAWGHGWEEAPVGLTGSATGGDGVKLL